MKKKINETEEIATTELTEEELAEVNGGLLCEMMVAGAMVGAAAVGTAAVIGTAAAIGTAAVVGGAMVGAAATSKPCRPRPTYYEYEYVYEYEYCCERGYRW